LALAGDEGCLDPAERGRADREASRRNWRATAACEARLDEPEREPPPLVRCPAAVFCGFRFRDRSEEFDAAILTLAFPLPAPSLPHGRGPEPGVADQEPAIRSSSSAFWA
jgi:hypothetical protein